MAISFLERHDIDTLTEFSDRITKRVKEYTVQTITKLLRDFEDLMGRCDSDDPQQDVRDVLKAVRKELDA